MDYNGTTPKLNNSVLIVIAAVIAVIFLLLVFFLNVYIPFTEERKYIKMEMGRTSGSEYRYWKKKLRKLYLSHIPIIRRFFKQ